MLIQTRTASTLPFPRYQSAPSRPDSCTRAEPSPDTYSPESGSKVRKTLRGMAVGAGLATAACLAVAGTINPLGAIVIFSATVVGGAYGANDGNIQPPEPGDFIDPSNPLNEWGR